MQNLWTELRIACLKDWTQYYSTKLASLTITLHWGTNNYSASCKIVSWKEISFFVAWPKISILILNWPVVVFIDLGDQSELCNKLPADLMLNIQHYCQVIRDVQMIKYQRILSYRWYVSLWIELRIVCHKVIVYIPSTELGLCFDSEERGKKTLFHIRTKEIWFSVCNTMHLWT